MQEQRHTEKSIFLEALEIHSAAERAAYLESACASNQPLRAEVEALLQAHETPQRLLDAPAATAPASDEGICERPGSVIGPYKLLQQIGEGGMGLVFMAEQLHPVQRKVALKIIKPGMDSRQVIARFEAERQALALMEHPHIAKVLDAGTTESGRAYFVMELVKGVSITEFCDRNCMPADQRLKLFIAVCHAIQHAHHKGVIHRDITPSNVMITLHDGVPVAKVIDFGVAKATAQKLTERTLFTAYGQIIGTPAYMSPEQAEMSGLDIDTRSDIYSLGVLLYELLTGTTPFDKERFQKAGFDEMRRIIREEEPPKPSRRISTLGQAATTVSMHRHSDPRKLIRLCRGELDWIVMKALEKDRTRRYETASAFAEDVQHYLSDEPVRACPPSAWYRWRKFARRHRGGVAMAAVISIAVVVTVAAVAGSIGWAQRDQAARDAGLVEAVNRELDKAEGFLRSGKWPSAVPAVESAAKLLAAGGRPLSRERLERLQQDLAMARRLEEIYSQPKEHQFFNGREQNDAYARAFREYGIDMAELPAAEATQLIRTRAIRLDLARALDFWSSMRRRAGNQGLPGWKQLLEAAMAADPDDWRNQLREALQKNDRKGLQGLAASANVGELPPETLTLLGRTLADFLGAPDQAVALLRQAQRQYPGDLWINDSLGWLYLNVTQPRQYDEAARFYTAALAVRPGTPFLVVGIGLALQAKGALAESAVEFSRAIELDPKLAPAWNARGWSYALLGQWEKALADYSEAIALDPTSFSAFHNRGYAHASFSHWRAALADWSQAIKLQPIFPPQLRVDRAFVFSIVGEWDQAAGDLSKLSAGPPSLGHDRWFQLACLRVLQGDDAGYQQLREQLVKLTAQSKEGFTGTCGYIAGRTGLLLPHGEKNPAPDMRWAEPMIISHPKSPWYLHTLALSHYRAGKFEEAITRVNDSLRIDSNWKGIAQNWLLLALAHQRLGQPEQARPWLHRAVQWRDRTLSASRPAEIAHPLQVHLSDWLEFQVLCREAESLFGKELKPMQQK